MSATGSGPHRLLGIATSPRRGGNSETLLDAVLEGARSAGADVTKLVLSELRIEGCRECGGCDATGLCVVQDDMQKVYDSLRHHDRLAFATPIYFLHMSSQAKMLVDRAQAPWVLTRRLGGHFAPEGAREGRKGALVACGGSSAGALFDCTLRTFRAFLAVIEMEYAGCVCAAGIDAAGAVAGDAALIEKARQAGAELVS